MKKLKKITSLFLALVMLLSLVALSSCTDSEEGTSSAESTVKDESTPGDSTTDDSTTDDSTDSTDTGDNNNSTDCQHINTTWITDTEADCYKQGSRHEECLECHATIKTEKTDIKHKDIKWVTDTKATCTKSGSRHSECTTCGKTVSTNTIDAIGHNFIGGICENCGESEQTTPPPTPSGDIRDRDYTYSKDTVLNSWRGKTLNILATKWYSDLAPCAPWAVAELCATEKDGDATGYGKIINNKILERNQLILDTYGVTLNWIEAPAGILSLLNVDSTTPNSDYHIAYPRAYEAQTLVMNGVVLDMAYSDYIDFRKSYFNQMAYEAYTVSGHTFFAAGDFSFLDEQTTFMIFYNKILAAEFEDFPDVYGMVRDGTWTADVMYGLAAAIGSDNGDGVWNDEDTYGFATTSFEKFFQYFGIQQVSVDKETQQYYISLYDERVNSVIQSIIYCMNATWSTTRLSNASQTFADNRLLFYNQAFQTINHFGAEYNPGVFEFGLLPFPKLNEKQDAYYSPVSYQSCLICIPKSAYWADGGKFMAEYFVDVLSWTGQEYLMEAYFDSFGNYLSDADSIEMLEEYIFPNMMYDQGYMYGWDGLLTKFVQIASYESGTNKFEQNYMQNEFAAMATVNDWNLAWGFYDEDDYKNP